MEKMMSLPFPKVRRSLTSQDHQPAPDNRIASTVVGRLKIDEDPAMGFRQIFLLKNANEKWICTDDNLQAAPFDLARRRPRRPGPSACGAVPPRHPPAGPGAHSPTTAGGRVSRERRTERRRGTAGVRGATVPACRGPPDAAGSGCSGSSRRGIPPGPRSTGGTTTGGRSTARSARRSVRWALGVDDDDG
ncbi:synaptojanin-1-like [Ornithorhynchus anatinus]|uniref:synaptojanin-1-like n=1 Tax=Ornithorhynchus anatinus TaxID=9258 RepID=UPI0010A8499E|nr:synaptojanin-1-like [Ornithorhynchus anatinus]